MRRRATPLLLALTAACVPGRAPAPLFEPRVALEPFLAKLKASGGDPAKVLRPRGSTDLAPLESGKRYKFVVLPDGSLAIAPLPADAPSNEYVHPVLAARSPVLTAGGIRLERRAQTLVRATLDQNSSAYCPTAGSLAAGFEALVRLGVPADRLRLDNRPPVCADAQAAAAGGPRYGALMADVGRRFERLGRAAQAGRYELAEFERGEIEEVFEEDLPKAELPRESAGGGGRGRPAGLHADGGRCRAARGVAAVAGRRSHGRRASVPDPGAVPGVRQDRRGAVRERLRAAGVPARRAGAAPGLARRGAAPGRGGCGSGHAGARVQQRDVRGVRAGRQHRSPGRDVGDLPPGVLLRGGERSACSAAAALARGGRVPRRLELSPRWH